MTYGDPTPTATTNVTNNSVDFKVPDFELRALKVRRLTAQATAAEFDAELAGTLAAAAALAHRKDNRKTNYEEAGDYHQRIFRFVAPVEQATALGTMDQLNRWDRLDNAEGKPSRAYFIYLTSPGGSIFPGISLFSSLKALAARRPVVTVASGFAASMATVIHQAGSIRLIERGSSYLIHNASASAYGEVHSLADQAKWIGRVNDDLHKILAERSTLTVEEIAVKAERRDWTLSAEETVQYGFADAIAGTSEAAALLSAVGAL